MSFKPASSGVALLLALLLSACGQEMDDQPKYETFEAAPQWPNNQAARDSVPGAVARDEAVDLRVPEELPMPLTQALLARGQERFNIYCSPCHGRVGYGEGMIVQRGFPAPPSFHSDRLRNAPLRHFYDVISEGYGVMYSYADRVAPEDRWAIAAYIQALQLSQYAPLEDLTPAQRDALEPAPGQPVHEAGTSATREGVQ
ncbi:c-type cytochrome [Halomonas sp. WWR20]